MSKLRMTYHPAKKEVQFERFGMNGTPIPIRRESVLYKYMNKRGQFVLQDYGDIFFEDIARAFDGEASVYMEVVTTKNDFGDLEQMIEYYNEGHEVKINATLLAELPDMNFTYDKVREHGEDAIKILKNNKIGFQSIQTDTEDVKKCIASFSKQVDESSARIREKIDCMGDNNINLCFAGVYSTGKSTLINAILGYKILPEAIKSETARMFEIKSPKNGKPVSISFAIDSEYTELLWNSKTQIFEFGAGPTENEVRANIQKNINSFSQKLQHEQILEILKVLNSSREVGSPITVYFPIPLDTPNTQFTIYDTPGADSNYLGHQRVLEDALSEQTHSILIFVVSPTKLEGHGNNALLSFLKEIEEKGSKTSIDIDRSLFVINSIDTVADPDQRKPLREAKITHKKEKDTDDNAGKAGLSSESFTIALANKKLFFTSALFGYIAKAERNHISTSRENWIFENRYSEIINEEYGLYYRLNHVATSECATQKLIKYCDDKLNTSKEKEDRSTAMEVGSGIYALEREILTYGEKYASAVKAFAIIDSVDKALSSMSNTASSLASQNKKDIEDMTKEIDNLRTTLTSSIENAYEKYQLKDGKLPDNTLKELKLDANSLRSWISEPTESAIEKILHSIFAKKAKDSDKEAIRSRINGIISNYTSEFSKQRKRTLESARDAFISEVKTAICKSSEISDEAKKYMCDIRPSKEIKPIKPIEIDELYEANTYEKKILFFIKIECVDKDKFKEDVLRNLAGVTKTMAQEYRKEYISSFDEMLNQVKNDFNDRLNDYSLLMQAMLADKDAMEKLREKITKAEKELANCQDELNSKIWSVSKNA